MAINAILKLKSTGDCVFEWQSVLLNSAYDLNPWGANGIFEESTYNATVSWQKERGLPGTGIVDEITIAKIGTSPGPISDPFSEDLDIKFIKSENYQPANRNNINLIILHCDKMIELPSVHFSVDDLNVIQYVKEEDVAYHAGSLNESSIGIEHAGLTRFTEDQWFDSYSTQMLKRSAKLTAHLCKKWNIPIQYNKSSGIIICNDNGQKFPIELYKAWIQQCFDDLG